MVRNHRPARHPARAEDCSPIGPTGSPRANCRRRSRRARKASSAMSSSPCGTGARPRSICTTRSRPTSAIRPSTPTARSTARPEWSTDYVPVLDPVNNRAYDIKVPVRDPKTPSSMTDPMFGAVALLGRRADLGQPDHRRTIRCSTRRAASGSPRASTGRQTPAFCQQGLGPSVGASCSRSNRPGAQLVDVRSEDRRSSR